MTFRNQKSSQRGLAAANPNPTPPIATCVLPRFSAPAFLMLQGQSRHLPRDSFRFRQLIMQDANAQAVRENAQVETMAPFS